MDGVEDIVNEPIKKFIKADCPSCKTEGSDFLYLGLNKTILDCCLGIDFFIEKYGKGVLFLYDCQSCQTSQTGASIKPYSTN